MAFPPSPAPEGAAPGGPTPGGPPPAGKVPHCDLCRAKKITPWYHEDEICWIAECDICETPMVVWRRHGVTPPA